MRSTNRREACAVQRLFLIFGTFCLAVLGAAGYWQVFRGPGLAEDPRNPRLRLTAGLRRGGILSADGEVLALSLAAGGGAYRREYRGTPGLSATVGYLSPRLGATGLEAAYDKHLRGASVESWVARLVALRGGAATGNPDLYLTIRSRVQLAAERAMTGRRGAVVALDPRSGEVLALVSLPGFAPGGVEASWTELRRDPKTPLVNRALSGLYPPGSAFKPAVALAALEAGRVRANEVFTCPGRRRVRGETISDLGGAVHGRIDFAEAMSVSCNYVFSGLAMRLKPGWFAGRVRAYGMLAPPGFGIGGEPGRFPEPGRLSPEDLAELGIGQGRLLLTPFGLARFAALLAAGGRPVEPFLVRGVGVRGAALVPLRFSFGLTGGPAAEARVVGTVGRMLVGAVSAGTGWRARLPDVNVAGKTGTAENPHGQPHAWFIGFAPLEEPRVAVAVVVENGGLGGEVAAPVAREVIAAALGR